MRIGLVIDPLPPDCGQLLNQFVTISSLSFLLPRLEITIE